VKAHLIFWNFFFLSPSFKINIIINIRKLLEHIKDKLFFLLELKFVDQKQNIKSDDCIIKFLRSISFIPFTGKYLEEKNLMSVK